ncbi:hypothetical protein [Candidatus Ichthyocystis sparus]|nr:hypothetical protein [Candidatus Ichthyocystis sparus]
MLRIGLTFLLLASHNFMSLPLAGGLFFVMFGSVSFLYVPSMIK